MSSPESFTPCQCCAPGALTPKGAIVTVSGVESDAYPKCSQGENFNGTWIMEFERAEGKWGHPFIGSFLEKF